MSTNTMQETATEAALALKDMFGDLAGDRVVEEPLGQALRGLAAPIVSVQRKEIHQCLLNAERALVRGLVPMAAELRFLAEQYLLHKAALEGRTATLDAQGMQDSIDLGHCVTRLRILEAHFGPVQLELIRCLLGSRDEDVPRVGRLVGTCQDYLTGERQTPIPDFVPTVGELHCLAEEYLDEWYRDDESWIIYQTVGSNDWKDMKRCEARLEAIEAILGTTEFAAVLAPVHERWGARLRALKDEMRRQREAEFHGTGEGNAEMALGGSGSQPCEDGDDDYPI